MGLILAMILNRSTHASGHVRSVTKSDATVFDKPTRGVYVGEAGDVAVRMAVSGNVLTFANVPAGTILPICVTQVRATDTDAGSIVILF